MSAKTKTNTRIMGRACKSSEFVDLAMSKGFSRTDAESGWRGMVEKTRRSGYNRPAALQENIFYGQIRDFQAGGRVARSNWGYVKPNVWQLIDEVVPALLASL